MASVLPVTSSVKLDDHHPWPGLAPYDEASRTYFQGRDDETVNLARLIEAHTVVSLYGKSGLGKSSLLQAGVFPLLREHGFLPIYARLNFAAAISPFDQLLDLLQRAACDAGLEHATPSADEELWQHLHRQDFELWTPDNHFRIPVFVLDQFEEVFSRTGDRQALAPLVDRLGDLLENRIPSAIASDKAKLASLDVIRCRYRFVVSFREDYLPDLRAWEPRLPSLLRQSMRLLPMTRDKAVQAVKDAGHAVLAESVAAQIVDFVASRPAGGDTEATVEPVMLSLCCTQLNRRRLPGRLIDVELLNTAGPNIVEDFYEDAMRGMPEHVHRFLEDHLVQGRVRGSYARDEAIEQGFIDAAQLDQLTSVQRLLRVDPQGTVARIELIHDRLVDVVRRARDARRAQQLADEAQREVVMRRQRRARSWIGVALTVVSVLAAVASVATVRLQHALTRATSLQAQAVAATAAAEQDKAFAVAQRTIAEQRLKQLTLLAGSGWAGNADPKLYADAVDADAAIKRLRASREPDAARPATTLDIFAKPVDETKVREALSWMTTLGFKVAVHASKLTDAPTNAVFFGTGAQIDDVKLVALALMRAGIPVQWIRRMGGDVGGSNRAVIQAGAETQADKLAPYTVNEVLNAVSFNGASQARQGG
ncbi:hypothetical protein K788_0006179 (plasmid) [Paraburkholderia caribensis MBA4]|uniref:Novel STAND NTPase 1 domain-containing protein n=2 Tax=Paraburkholderia caribensis TaxID=75105 RepID=A0A0P0RM53_9BURK|nr:hypothetical protein K788_0006179 [Paraburkholderia caribensis MBA4]